MRSLQKTWAVVLAAGEGTQLAQLTKDASGNAVPKQFCSLNGGPSLLHEALQRARHVVPRGRLCAIVAEQHRRHWCSTLQSLPATNVIRQPVNRGTANGVLLSVLSILRRDALARILFLPADHYVRDERALGGALRETLTLLTRTPEKLVLIGIEPEEPDPELGYIVPGEVLPDGSRTVQAFAEKPDRARARQLLSAGSLWNSFIFGTSGPTLLRMIRARMGDIVDRMEAALARDATSDSGALEELYEQLPTMDFSRQVIEGSEGFLRVIRAPACGWSDLGTPARVAATLRRLKAEQVSRGGLSSSIGELFGTPAVVNLATRYSQP